MSNRQPKVIVGMSGGVDSSVAAALLLRDGYEVVGAFMKNWPDGDDAATGTCSWRVERDDARRVAAKLGIELLTFDFEKEYREAVMDYMVREYAAGRTPNPDVLCNQFIKFGPFLREALARGADFIATGHYARVERDASGASRLLAGVDNNKDQSYFLHRLNQEQLARTLFPIGALPKPEVRRLAREFGLPTADKKDSQGICFVGKVSLKEFLAPHIAAKPGDVVTLDGHVVGRHQGLAPFTIGQRHGLGISGGEPYFVARKDVERNELVVAPASRENSLASDKLTASQAHWISGKAPTPPQECQARIRYRQPLQQTTINSIDPTGKITVSFAQPQRAITPGQFIVFYDGEVCLGGAVIES